MNTPPQGRATDLLLVGLLFALFALAAVLVALGLKHIARRMCRTPGLPDDGDELDEHEAARLADLEDALRRDPGRNGRQR